MIPSRWRRRPHQHLRQEQQVEPAPSNWIRDMPCMFEEQDTDESGCSKVSKGGQVGGEPWEIQKIRASGVLSSWSGLHSAFILSEIGFTAGFWQKSNKIWCPFKNRCFYYWLKKWLETGTLFASYCSNPGERWWRVSEGGYPWKWLDSGFILGVEEAGITDRLNGNCERTIPKG